MNLFPCLIPEGQALVSFHAVDTATLLQDLPAPLPLYNLNSGRSVALTSPTCAWRCTPFFPSRRLHKAFRLLGAVPSYKARRQGA
jgi:hypothetical protein